MLSDSLDCPFVIAPLVFSDVYLSCVLCTLCYQFLWIVYSWSPLWYSLTSICPVSCVPYVASFSGLSILYCPFGILWRLFVLCLVYPMLSDSLDCPFLITPLVFSNVYLSCVLCTLCCQILWIVHLWLPLWYSLTFICLVSCVPYVVRFSGLSICDYPLVFSNVYLSYVFCTLCCQFLWIVYFWLPLWYSLTFISPVSCVPYVVRFSGLYIFNCPFGILWCLFVLCLEYPMLSVSLDCIFLIAPLVFSDVYLSCVLCTLCCQFLWIAHFWLPLWYSLTFICPVSCVPYVASFSGLYICDCPFGILWRLFVQCLVYPMLPVSRDCIFLIAPLVFSEVYLSCVLCTLCCQFLWIVYFWLPLWYSLTCICPVSCVPYVASFSGLYIFDCPFGILWSLFVLCLVYAMLPISLDCVFLIAPLVLSDVYLSCVLCTLCCQFLWIVYFWLPLWYSLKFICPVSCVPYVASFSGLYIYDCPFGILWRVFVLCLVYPMLPVSLDCPFMIAPLVFSDVYLSCFLCTLCCQILWIVYLWLPLQFSLTFICPVPCVPYVVRFSGLYICDCPFGFLWRLLNYLVTGK
jgi:hypothetical protein